MTLNFSLAQQRFAALIFLALTLVLAWFLIIGPAVSYVEDRGEKRRVDLRSLRRDRALIAQDPSVITALETVDHSPRWGRLYEGRKAEAVILEIETDLRALIKSPNNPTSMVAQGIAVKGSLTQVAVKVTLSMPIDQLADTLARVQAHSRYLRIENLLIQAPDHAPADSNPTLSIQADVVGYLPTPGPKT